ncbi:uncharacterized protein LOC135361460 [Mirounga angustirostris]|uniref:uncharacterized protein LOC135361460 n=1 Tax=Mirounga angustirostris TaxID=9716 RepID=UPI00313BDCB4
MESWDRAKTPFQESNLRGQIGRTLRASNTSLISVCPAFTSVHADAKMENRLMEHIIRPGDLMLRPRFVSSWAYLSMLDFSMKYLRVNLFREESEVVAASPALRSGSQEGLDEIVKRGSQRTERKVMRACVCNAHQLYTDHCGGERSRRSEDEPGAFPLLSLQTTFLDLRHKKRCVIMETNECQQVVSKSNALRNPH